MFGMEQIKNGRFFQNDVDSRSQIEFNLRLIAKPRPAFVEGPGGSGGTAQRVK